MNWSKIVTFRFIPAEVFTSRTTDQGQEQTPHEVLEQFSLGFRDHFGSKVACTYQLFAATELLLAYYARGEISDSDLDALLKSRFEYVEAFTALFDATLDSCCEQDDVDYVSREHYAAYLDRVSGGSTSVIHGRRRKIYDAFLEVMRGVAASLQDSDDNSALKPSLRRKFRSKTYWLNYKKYLWFTFPEKAGVVDSYERSLATEDAFAEDSRILLSQVALKSWRYWHETLFLDYDWSAAEAAGVSEAVENDGLFKDTLADFCSKWCLQFVGVKRAGLPCTDNKVVFYRARRPRVQISDGGDGLTVFIPRFYQFSHIKNHASEDFSHLKDAMDNIFDYYRKTPPKQLSHAERSKEAVTNLNKLTKMGVNPVQAWEQVRREMAWSEATMRSSVGEPRFRPSRVYRPKPEKPSVAKKAK